MPVLKNHEYSARRTWCSFLHEGCLTQQEGTIIKLTWCFTNLPDAWNTLKLMCIWFIWLNTTGCWFHITSKSMLDKKIGVCNSKIRRLQEQDRRKIASITPKTLSLIQEQFHEIMKTFEREEHDAAFYMRSVRLNRKVQSSSSHGFSQIHLLHETPWRKYAIDSFDSVQDFGDSILHQSQWQTKNLVIAETRLEQDQVIVRTRPEKNCKHHTQDIVTYSRTISWNYEDIWKRRTWCSFLHEECPAQQEGTIIKLTWCFTSSLDAWNTLKEICIWFIWLCKRLWWFHITSKSMADKKFGDCRNKIGARSGDCRNKTEETMQASHPRHCHLFKSSFMILWRHMKEKNMMQLFTWGMSDSTGRYNDQAHMVFHKFTYCMKHLEGNMQLIHLTQYKTLVIPYYIKVNGRQKIWWLQKQDWSKIRWLQKQDRRKIASITPKTLSLIQEQFHEIMETYEREEHDAAFYMRDVWLNRKVQSSSSHGVSQIHLMHETPWSSCAFDSFDSI